MTTTQVFSTPVFFDEQAGSESLNRELALLIKKRAASEKSDDAFRAHHGGYYSSGAFFDEQAQCVKHIFDLTSVTLTFRI